MFICEREDDTEMCMHIFSCLRDCDWRVGSEKGVCSVNFITENRLSLEDEWCCYVVQRELPNDPR